MVQFTLSIRCLPITVSSWQPVTPLGRPLFVSKKQRLPLSRQGVPHQSTSDDLYIDYHISANSVVISNQLNGDFLLPRLNIELWLFLKLFLLNRAMLNDEREYPELHEFKPERFLKNGKLDSSVRDPMDIAFGGESWGFLSTLVHFTSLSIL